MTISGSLADQILPLNQHGGSLPTTSNRAEFVALLNAGRQPGNADEENFDEAIAALGKHVWRPIASEGVGGGGIPPEVRDMFKDPACENLGPKVCTSDSPVLARKSIETHPFCANLPRCSHPTSGSWCAR